MGNHQKEQTSSKTTVLVVPQDHVKLVKSALERIGHLDRTTKITPETSKSSSDAIAGDLRPNQHGHDEGVSGTLQDHSAAAITGDLSSNQQTVRFPALKFDVVSGEYVDPSVLEKTSQRSVSQFPALKFDSESGEYVDPINIVQDGGQQTTSRFPALKFDVVSGEYVDPSILKKRDQQHITPNKPLMRIPTTIPYAIEGRNIDEDTSGDQNNDKLKLRILEDLSLDHLFEEISVSFQVIHPKSSSPPESKNPLSKALREALENLPENTLKAVDLETEALVSSFPDSYSIYKPMLLLPHNAFSSDAWQTFLSNFPADSDLLRPVWQRIAEAVGTTYVAVNSPIPLQKNSTGTSQEVEEKSEAENILRSPVNLTPIYGDFGSPPTSQTLSSPTQDDFKSAFWVTTTQNGIHQTWAPRYTMFSRGNIREKSRVLNLPSVTQEFDCPSAAADLYAGIGYFVFSYKKAGLTKENGIKKVLCWELNPWSVEGLRRGAEMNGWTYRIWGLNDIPSQEADRESWIRDLTEAQHAQEKSEDFWIFQLSNEYAGPLVQHLSTPKPPLIPPIRHINLGLLPSSTLSWHTAVRILYHKRGGWIHVHENVGIKDLDARTKGIELEFQRLVTERDEREGRTGEKVQKRARSVKIEHVERVKMYAPGVVHAVFDVAVEGLATS